MAEQCRREGFGSVLEVWVLPTGLLTLAAWLAELQLTSAKFSRQEEDRRPRPPERLALTRNIKIAQSLRID